MRDQILQLAEKLQLESGDLGALYMELDIDRDGLLSQQDLQQSLGDTGRNELAEFLFCYDRDQDGHLGFEEFLLCARKKPARVQSATLHRPSQKPAL